MDKTYNVYGQYKTQKSGCNTEVVQSLHPLISNYPFIFYLFTLLLYYLFTLYHIDTLLWLHIAKESTVKVVIVALGWSLDIRSDDTGFSLFRNTNHAPVVCKVNSNVVGTRIACK